MLWDAVFKLAAAGLRHVVVEASNEDKAKDVAATWASQQGGEIVGPVTPFVVADESILEGGGTVPSGAGAGR